MGTAAAIAMALGGLASEFEADDLARELLKSKSELRLCDALAARLGAQFTDDPTTRVAREWGRGEHALGRLRIDLAVLRGGRPAALIEAKAANSFALAIDTDRRYPSGEVRSDIEKMRMVDVDGERYVLLLVTHNHQVPDRVHDAEVTYSDYFRRHGVIDDATIRDGFERFRLAVGDVAVSAHGRVRGGRAFGVDVSLLYWLMEVL